MQGSLLEILREIPDHRCREGKRFDLATILLYAILAIVAGPIPIARCMSSIALIAGGLTMPSVWRCLNSPSYAGLRLILQGLDPTAVEAAFRRHAASMPTPLAAEALTAIAVDGKTRFQQSQGRAHDVGAAARRQNRPRACDRDRLWQSSADAGEGQPVGPAPQA